MSRAIAIDLGTTSIKAGILDLNDALQHLVLKRAPPINNFGGHFESDAIAYAETAERVLVECMAYAEERLPLGMCSQRSSFLIWERTNGKPVTPLISWQDDRGKTACTALNAHEELISDLTGLRLVPYYLAPKLYVLLQQHPEWRVSLECGDWLVGTLDTFLIWRWTNGAHHLIDASMAARTLLMDISQAQWSPVLGKLFNIPLDILPRIIPSANIALPLTNGLTLQSCLGDQSAAFLACACSDDVALVNLGTGGFVIRTLPNATQYPNGYLRTLLYQNDGIHLATEGTINSIASAFSSYPVAQCRAEDLACNDIYCLAEPSGLGAPYFRNDLGIVFSQPVTHLLPLQIAALFLESVIFRVARIIEEFNQIAPIKVIYLSGGRSKLLPLQQGIAQCVGCEVCLLQEKDASLLGAALLACERTAASFTENMKIAAKSNPKLQGKYQAWKKWLDAKLAISTAPKLY